MLQTHHKQIALRLLLLCTFGAPHCLAAGEALRRIQLPEHIKVTVEPLPCHCPAEQVRDDGCRLCQGEGVIEATLVNGYYTLIDEASRGYCKYCAKHGPSEEHDTILCNWNSDNTLYSKDEDPQYVIESSRNHSRWKWHTPFSPDDLSKLNSVELRDRAQCAISLTGIACMIPSAGLFLASFVCCWPCWAKALFGSLYGGCGALGVCGFSHLHEQPRARPKRRDCLYMTITMEPRVPVVTAGQITDAQAEFRTGGYALMRNVTVSDVYPEYAFRKYIDEQTDGQLPPTITRGWLVKGVLDERQLPRGHRPNPEYCLNCQGERELQERDRDGRRLPCPSCHGTGKPTSWHEHRHTSG